MATFLSELPGHAHANQDLVRHRIGVNLVFVERIKCHVSISANARDPAPNVTNDNVPKNTLKARTYILFNGIVCIVCRN